MKPLVWRVAGARTSVPVYFAACPGGQVFASPEGEDRFTVYFVPRGGREPVKVGGLLSLDDAKDTARNYFAQHGKELGKRPKRPKARAEPKTSPESDPCDDENEDAFTDGGRRGD